MQHDAATGIVAPTIRIFRARVTVSMAVMSLLVCTAAMLLSAQVAFASDAPHIPDGTETDACAICHRAHTSASDATWTAPALGTESRSALLVGSSIGVGDTELCFACHGLDALGSEADVQTSFTSESSHPIAPDSGAFGPQPMDCSSCHDSHGSERDTDGDPFAALLRTFSISDPTDVYYQGNEYCAACHEGRPNDIWDGLSVWQQTAHSAEITPPANGTGIVCSVCHDGHGSNNPPLIVEQILPPAAPTTLTVPANGRWLCFSCHAASYATYPPGAIYQTSSHAVSESTVTAIGEWASVEDTRTVGECQNCHNPMGASDGSGGVIPKLTVAEGRAVCDRCHTADNPDAADIAQFKFPIAQSSRLELAVAWNAERLGNVFDRLAVWTQDTTGTAPLDLIGPRVFDVPGSSVDAAWGDIDGDNAGDIVIADAANTSLIVFSRTPLQSISYATYSLDATPTYVGVGDLIVDGSGLPEIMVVSRLEIAPFTSRLDVYRFSSAGNPLTRVFSNVALGNDASGIAVGDIRIEAPASDEVVVTCMGDDTIRTFAESTVTPGTLVTASHATLSDPRGPSIGDADAGSSGNEIVIANSGEAVNTLSVFSGAGVLLDSYAASVTPGAVPYDTIVANVLPSLAGDETVIVMRHATGTSGFNVFPRSVTSGLLDGVDMQTYTTGLHTNSASLAAGDVDSDGEVELVVGNAGTWANVGFTPTPPSVMTYSADGAGTALSATPVELLSEGVEVAGQPPAVLAVDLGPLGESRHPTSVAQDAHNSTETASFARHVECGDCHNVHEATSTVPPLGAPLVRGEMKGSWGVSVTNNATDSITYSSPARVDYEYETCFKCHSGYSATPFTPGDIASLVNTRNPSFHAIETSTTNSMATSGSFVSATPAWSNSSVMHCTTCHGNSDGTEPSGPHASEAAPLQRYPFWGTATDDADYLCYECHKQSVYRTGVDDDYTGATYSNFYDSTLTEPKLHKLHVDDKGFSCGTCHQNHGSPLDPHLMRAGLDWVHSATGGACFTPCHGGSTANAYSRVTTEYSATSVTRIAGGTLTGGLAEIATIDGSDLTLAEDNVTPGFNLEIVLNTGGVVPTSFKLYGYYQGNVGHRVYVEVWDQVSSGWHRIAQMPNGTVDDEYTYPIADARYVSGTGDVRMRIYHESPGNVGHVLRIDRAWLRR